MCGIRGKTQKKGKLNVYSYVYYTVHCHTIKPIPTLGYKDLYAAVYMHV